MTNEEQIERLLAQVPVPRLREGPHREELKAELLDPTRPSQRKGEEPMRTARPFRRTLIRLAAGLLVAALLVATGWAAEKLYQIVANSFVILEEETLLEKRSEPVKLSDGTFRSTSTTVRILVGTVLPEDASPGAVEKAMQGLEEMKQLIGQKKYEFIKTHTGPSGEEEYLYRFTLADGRQIGMNFSIPLENVASWDDYLEKISEQAKQRHE